MRTLTCWLLSAGLLLFTASCGLAAYADWKMREVDRIMGLPALPPV